MCSAQRFYKLSFIKEKNSENNPQQKRSTKAKKVLKILTTGAPAPKNDAPMSPSRSINIDDINRSIVNIDDINTYVYY